MRNSNNIIVVSVVFLVLCLWCCSLQALTPEGTAILETLRSRLREATVSVASDFRPVEQSDPLSVIVRNARNGDASEQLVLGKLVLEGGRYGVKADPAEAVFWLKKSGMQGNREAQYLLGGLLATGRGVRKNQIEAFAWLSVAAESEIGADNQDRRFVTLRDQTASEMSVKNLQKARARAADLKNKIAEAEAGLPIPGAFPCVEQKADDYRPGIYLVAAMDRLRASIHAGASDKTAVVPAEGGTGNFHAVCNHLIPEDESESAVHNTAFTDNPSNDPSAEQVSGKEVITVGSDVPTDFVDDILTKSSDSEPSSERKDSSDRVICDPFIESGGDALQHLLELKKTREKRESVEGRYFNPFETALEKGEPVQNEPVTNPGSNDEAMNEELKKHEFKMPQSYRIVVY